MKIEVRLSDTVEARLEHRNSCSAWKSNRYYCRFCPVHAGHPMSRRRKPSGNLVPESLGEGNKPKNIKEVMDYQARSVAEPLQPKAELFFDHYQSKGWVVGKSPVKHWGSCLTIWLRNNPDWRPVPATSKDSVSLQEFLEWAEDKRPPIFEKYRTVSSLQDIDQR